MLIKEISIQNFKSFGNNKQTIKFSDRGELVLLYGDNGAGKSSFQESIDFTLFGMVRGKERKRIPQTELPNRINGSLLTSIKYINNNGDDIEIERGLKPSKLKVIVNSNDITSSYKKYNQDKKEELIGMNYDIYKSFVSMSLNDFTNFISLDPDTKRKLLNKLFNLGELDEYYNITKDIIKNNNRSIDKINVDIDNNINTINTYKENVKNIKDIKNDNDLTKDDIKKLILSKKSRFIELKENKNDLSVIINELNKDINNRKEILQGMKHRIDKIDLKIEDYDDKIKIFKSGKCPVCNTILETSNHKHDLNDFIKKKDDLLDERQQIEKDMNIYRNDSKDIYIKRKGLLVDIKKLSEEYKELGYELKSLKNEFDNFNKNNVAIIEIEKNIKILEDKNDRLVYIVKDIKNKNDKYKKLNNIFSTTGIRKSIIENVVIPINKYLSNYLKDLESSFRVEINNEFDAEIYERYVNKINTETISTGENKKINMALSLSYLEIIRKIRKSNILFLDEIFANVDSENINLLLKTLKKFAYKYNINVIVISQEHSPFDITLFDKLIRIDKSTFSMIRTEEL